MRVIALTITLFVIGLTAAVANHNRAPVELPFAFPGWSIFLTFLALSATIMTWEVGEDNHAVLLTDIALIIGLFSLDRTDLLIAGTAAWVASSVLMKSQRSVPLKNFFNLSLRFFEYSLAIFVFDSFPGSPVLTSTSTWVRVLMTLAVATSLSALAVTLVIFLATKKSEGELRRNLTASVIHSTMSTALTIPALILYKTAPGATAFLLVIGVLVVVPSRQLNRLRRKHETLRQIHEFTAGLAGSTDLESTLARVLHETMTSLRVSSASVQLLREHADLIERTTGDHLKLGVGDPVWRQVILNKALVRLARGSHEFSGYLQRVGAKDLMSVPLVHENVCLGAVAVWNRVGDISTFDNDDLSIFVTMAHQVTVTLKNLDLIDQLRDEAAVREYQALHDDLTGLPNRAHLYQAIDRAIDTAVTPFVAVAICDLNRFKEVNDSLGHQAGDLVLVEAARRLRKSLPSSAFVARLGGDEFALFFSGEENAASVNLRLQTVQEAFTTPFRVAGLSVHIDMSVGVSTYPLDASDRIGLLKLADVAMYAAKADRSGPSVRFYDPSQQQTSARQLTLLGDLREAISCDAIDVAYQPKVSMETGDIVGVEALARWNHPVYGNIAPDEFIPLAENGGLMVPLTDFMIRRSVAAIRNWAAAGYSLSVAVNVDAGTLSKPRFIERVFAILDESRIPASHLVLELTERDIVAHYDAMHGSMERLRARSIRISIDDFGTGYSSLSHLTHLPIDELKIDRSFILNVANPADATVVQAIITMAKGLGLHSVVEGIEDWPTWNAVAGFGCDSAQGFLLSRPLSEQSLSDWIAERALTSDLPVPPERPTRQPERSTRDLPASR
jgi:diguanylate cyclase (GGDEF)-like protein